MKVRILLKLKVVKWCEIFSEIQKQRLKRCENSWRIQNQNNMKSFKCWTPVNLILEVWLDKSIRCWELEESAVFAVFAAAAAVWVRFLLSVVLVEKGSWDIIMWINNVVWINCCCCKNIYCWRLKSMCNVDEKRNVWIVCCKN